MSTKAELELEIARLKEKLRQANEYCQHWRKSYSVVWNKLTRLDFANLILETNYKKRTEERDRLNKRLQFYRDTLGTISEGCSDHIEVARQALWNPPPEV